MPKKTTVRVSKKELSATDDIKNELIDKYKAEFDKLVESKTKEFEEKLYDFSLTRDNEILEKDGKIDTLALENFFFRALAPVYGVEAKYSPALIDLASDFFWQCIEKIYNRGIRFVPTLHLFSSMIGVSSTTLTNYAQSSDPEMRDTMVRIRDRFISFYTSRGLKREISEVMAIFTLKSIYGLRDNEPQNITYNDTKIVMPESMRDAILQNVSKYKNIVIDTDSEVI